MGQEAKEMKIIDARKFATSSGTGLVVLTTNFRFFVVNNIKDPRIRRFPDIPGKYLSLFFMLVEIIILCENMFQVLILPLAAGQQYMVKTGRRGL